MEVFLSLCLALGLSAACGFRIFVPLLVLSAAARIGQVELAEGFAWIASDLAILTFGAATMLEILAYYVPWFDNLLDSVSSPAAVIAGTVITASVVVDVDPFLQWTLALIAGGGAAGLFHGSTSVARMASSLSTGGIGNPVVSTTEAGISTGLSLLAVTWPVLAACLVIGLILWVVRIYRYWLERKRQRAAARSLENGIA